MFEIIEKSLSAVLHIDHLCIENQSYFHRHHKEGGKGRHFALTVVSADFEGLNAVKRHQRIYQALDMPQNTQIHALSISAFTPEEWEQQRPDVSVSSV